MGHGPADPDFEPDLPEHVPSSIAALTPAPKPVRHDESRARGRRPAARDRRELRGRDASRTSRTPAPAPVAPQGAGRGRVGCPSGAAVPAVAPGRKAAFTLRLDAERHLRLRLATAVTGRSAQQIVTGALDQVLAAIPEVDALAERARASGQQAELRRQKGQ